MINIPSDLLYNGLTKPLEKTLHNQTIKTGDPGPILLDAQTLIEAIGDGIPTSSKYFALPQGRLVELNQKLTAPLEHRIKRPQLRSFPTLMGLFLLLRAHGLVVGESKPRRIVMMDPAMLEQWSSLSATEQYMSLVNAWLTAATFDSVGERRSFSGDLYHLMTDVYLNLEDEVTELSDDRFGMYNGRAEAVTLALLHQFGWVRLVYESTAKEGKTASIKSVERLPLGDAMVAAMCRHSGHWKLDRKQLESTLRPYFPAWKHTLQLPDPEFRPGQFTLKLSWGKIWRRLVAPAETILDDIAYILLDAFEFDHDHLYQFELTDRLGKHVRVAGPVIEDADYFADEMRLGDLPLGEGDTMTFIYDFGDNWQFTISIEEIDEDCKPESQPKITKKSGTPPEQYDQGDWDEEWE